MQLQYAFNESMNDGYKFLFTYEILRGVHAIRLKSIQSSLSLQRSFFYVLYRINSELPGFVFPFT